MADMFYSLQEACSKLGKTEDEVKALVASGQLEEIRDGEDLKFAAADIDVLAGSNDSVGDLTLFRGHNVFFIRVFLCYRKKQVAGAAIDGIFARRCPR